VDVKVSHNPIKKRVCLVIPSLHAGGMERVMSELASYFATKPSIELHLILYGIKREIFYPLPANIAIHKPAFEFDNSNRMLSTIKTLFFLRKIIRRLNPTSVLSFGEYWNSFVLLSTVGLKYPVYVSDRCQPDKKLAFLHHQLRKYLYPTAAGVIAQTEKAKEIYKAFYHHSNVKVIANPIREIKTNGIIIKDNIVLSVGRLIKSKNHDELIKLFVKINKPGWKLIIVGDDAIKQQNASKLKKLIAELKAEEEVILAGKQTNVEAYYLTSKIFAFTSCSEGFPNVIGEAQSSGLPVIAFDCTAGPADLITNNANGYLIPLFDYTDFQSRLEELMNSDALQKKLGQQAQRDVKQYELKLICNKYLNFILKNTLSDET
jgi:GalNAc-alpha-(1->4)-GalNAc-alpha-(1->3)-diNAcBac-PP-undecaprenol alpha-1,4-N-acetyl-D-galactosaminyltransferase